MKKILYCIAFLTFILLTPALQAQDSSKINLKGFFEFTNTAWAPSGSGNWLDVSGILNRLDFHWYPTKELTLYAGMRNNFNYGSMLAAYYPVYKNYLLKDDGLVNMTFSLAGKHSYLLYSNIDRLNLRWNHKKLEATIGRQRINWGINLIWNPNDIFNTYNYFNFDYVERPGSDAVHAQYYTGALSSVQVAAKLNHEKQLTTAAMYKFNYKNYDIQLLSGMMDSNFVTGGGWAGQIKGAGFTGELSYFRNLKSNTAPKNQVVASVEANYTFPKGLFLNGSILYNSAGKTGKAGQRDFLQMNNMSPKTLTLSKINLFGEVSYPVTPLIKADLSSVVNPYDGSTFIGPSVDFNISDNMELLGMAQIFTGKNGTEYGGFGQMYYVRLKWNF